MLLPRLGWVSVATLVALSACGGADHETENGPGSAGASFGGSLAAGGMSFGDAGEAPVEHTGGAGGVGGESFEPVAAGGRTLTWAGGAGERGGRDAVTCPEKGGTTSGGAPSGGTSAQPDEPMIVEKSWDAELVFDNKPLDAPPDVRFLLQQAKGTSSSDNALISCTAERRYLYQPTAYQPQTLKWPTTDAVAVDMIIPCDPQIRISSFEWQGVDTDADGELDYIEGNGKAQQIPEVYDPANPPALGPLLDVKLRARADSTPPTLRVPEPAHPLDQLVITASEPLSADSQVLLSKGAVAYSMAVQADAQRSLNPLVYFVQDTILPLGDTWQILASGKDGAGLPLSGPFPSVTTLREPGIFLQDGFESGGTARLVVSGNAHVVQSHRAAPPIHGDWSLVIEEDGEATLHLVREPCQRLLRWTVGMVQAAETLAPTVTAGVIGGLKRPQLSISPKQPAGSLQEQLLILEDEGPDVLVRFAIPSRATCFPAFYCTRTPIIMIDDVRIE